MNKEIVFILEPDTGRVCVESSRTSADVISEIKRNLGRAITVNCGKPQVSLEIDLAKVAKEVSAEKEVVDSKEIIYLFRLYHYSTVDGPGRRSVVQLAGCSIRCPGFIYSLKWEKYNMTHERTETTTFCSQYSSPTMAEAFS